MTVRAGGLSDSMRALLEALRRDADQVFGTRRIEIIPGQAQVRESSEVVRAEVRTHTRTVNIFAKVFRPRPGEAGLAATHQRFRRDCDITRRVFQAMQSSPDLRAVELLASYDQIPGMVTREVKGTPLNAMIAANAAWPVDSNRISELEMTLTRLGRWIATFQTVASDVSVRLDLGSVREYIDQRLRKLTELPRAGFSQQDRRRLLGYFDARAIEVDEQELEMVPVHGDIVPSNVICAPNAVTVLDFGMTGVGAKYLDIARIFTQLDFYAAKPQFRPHVIADLQRAVLRGFDPTLQESHPLFEICAVQHVVCHLLSHARQPGRFPASLYSAHLRRRHRTWLRERIRARSSALAV